MDAHNGEPTPDLPRDMQRAFTASGWRKYQMRQRLVGNQIPQSSESEIQEAEEAS